MVSACLRLVFFASRLSRRQTASTFNAANSTEIGRSRAAFTRWRRQTHSVTLGVCPIDGDQASTAKPSSGATNHAPHRWLFLAAHRATCTKAFALALQIHGSDDFGFESGFRTLAKRPQRRALLARSRRATLDRNRCVQSPLTWLPEIGAISRFERPPSRGLR